MTNEVPESPRVAHLVWNVIRGGTEGQCSRVAIKLAGQGHIQRVAVFRREGFFLEAIEQACGPVYELPVRSIRHVATWRHVRRFSHWLKKERIDVLHAWDADAAVFGSIAARLAHIPFITSRRDLGEIYARWKLTLMKYADHRAKCVVVNAQAIQNKMPHLSAGGSKVVCIPNILDVDEFDVLADQPFPGGSTLPAGRRIAMVARLDPEKDVGMVIRAAAAMKNEFPDVYWIIAGEGRERTSLEQLAQTLGVLNRVVFLGEVQDVPALLRQCIIGVLIPKTNEGLSNTLLEYMASSLPVVATDCGGNSELVQPSETGYTVPIGEVPAFVEQVSRLLNDEDEARRLGRKGRERILQRHHPDRVGCLFLDLYRRARL